MIKRFRGKAKEEWEEEVAECGYVQDFIETKYFIDMNNGALEIINPTLVIDTRNWNDFTHTDNRDNNYLRFVLNDDEIIDIPKENIIYIKTSYGEHRSSTYVEGN